MQGGEVPEVDWYGLAARLIHPVKAAIIEALIRIDLPLSPNELVSVFDRSDYYLSWSPTTRQLGESGALVQVDERRARGARGHFYVISEELLKR